jgi:hypothetical protein
MAMLISNSELTALLTNRSRYIYILQQAFLPAERAKIRGLALTDVLPSLVGGGGRVEGHDLHCDGSHRGYAVPAAYLRAIPQSRQSAKLFLQSSELGLAQPLTRRRVCPPPPPGSGGSGTLAGERGVGRVPIPTRGHTLWYSLSIRTLCIIHPSSWKKICTRPSTNLQEGMASHVSTRFSA